MNDLPRLGLYIHIPFCERKCPYCDFNTYAGLEALYQATVEALIAEMARWADPLAGRTISTVFVGGGTPTVLSPRQLEQLFVAVHRTFHVGEDVEITCEANPGAVDREKFAALRALGVNRLSMGVQSFQAEELRLLGRIHSAEDARVAYDMARRAGFDNINLDFIFGLPQQSAEAWAQTLEEALALQPEHLSLYSLIVEPDTPFFHWVNSGKIAAPDEDLSAAFYEMAMERLAQAGYLHYEISNWARRASSTDSESETPHFACRHNLLYWRNEDYLGVGPGAHSHLRMPGNGSYIEQRWGNVRPVRTYVRRTCEGEPLAEFVEDISPPLAMGESMMLGLRLVREGVRLDRFAALHGRSPAQVFEHELRRLSAAGLLTLDAERIRLSRRGVLFGNQVFLQFLPEA
ncbi:radical SAM family heme chaperone HemW [Caldilinea sp.]|jgi:oxygen-independent coproporphyrinogen-3 oxidase|uniref:radical SAM family heme chaperone HemW n=1 Tax=Caldilinea sp. TaxID=2293560 RepID=UPI0021DF281A|nr:radical SAM family heme chaperone HemW [Caldilinea sp.]GIV70177.1 MAG: coproporphyrinogen III oxidase [Caldilinea sp.]